MTPHVEYPTTRMCDFCGEELEWNNMTGWNCTNLGCLA